MIPSRSLLSCILACLLLFPGTVSGQAIVEAAKQGRLYRVEALAEAHPESIEEADPDGYTALRWAAIRGHREVLLFLVGAGSDPNTLGADGGTPLHGAAHHDDPAMMRALLTAGADVTRRNQWGRTPLHVAARRGCLSAAQILLDSGADPDAVTLEGWSTLNVAYRGGHPDLVDLLLKAGADPLLADAEGALPGTGTLERPMPISLPRRRADEYVGRYDLRDGSGFDVWREGDRLRVMEFAPDDLIPVGPDTFYAAMEPWRAVFHRDEEGFVSSLEVSFLRRTVAARRVSEPPEGASYVGSAVCMGCHALGPGDGPAGLWIASRHSRAFHTLSSDQARTLAAGREEYRDMSAPSQDQRCLACHVTSPRVPVGSFAENSSLEEGVGCESCHGPGGSYANAETMGDREAFLAMGGRIPDELTCRRCHRDQGFQFLSRLERIRHW